VYTQAIRKLPANPERRVQTHHWLLGHEADLLSSYPEELSFRKFHEVLTVEPDLSAADKSVTWQDSEDCHCGDGLTASRLADDSDNLSSLNFEGDVFNQAGSFAVLRRERNG
jgi:hypothetical protein